VTLQTGHGFECFKLHGTVWCRGVSIDHDLGFVDPVGFVPLVADSDSDIISLETWDDTVCFTTMAVNRPYMHNTSGISTYCVGEATLGGAIGAFPAVYSGPNFTEAANGSPDLTFGRAPMMGGDFPMTDLLNSTFMTDGFSFVGQTTIDCLESGDGTTLTCPSFELAL
jgi:hypothetical protein